MSAEIERLQFVIETELNPLRQGLNQARRHIEGLRPVIGAIGFALTAAIARGFQNVVQSADALRDVGRVLQGLGYDVDAVGGRIQQMADELAKTTRYGDSDVLRAFKSLLSITRDVQTSLALWGVALDIAADQGIDVETAAEAVARYVTDGSGQLIRWYPFLKEASTEAERMKAVTRDLGPIIGGAASRSANLSNAWSHLKETAGDFFKSLVPWAGEGGAVIDLLNGLADSVRNVTEWVGGLDEVAKGLLGVASVSALLIGGPAALSGLLGSLGLGGLASALSGVGTILAPLGLAIAIFGAAWVTNFGNIRERTAEFVERVRPALDRIKDGWAAFWSGLKGIWEQISPGLEYIFGSLLQAFMTWGAVILEILGGLLIWLGNIFTGEWGEAWKTIGNTVLNVLDIFFPGFRERWEVFVKWIREDLWSSIKEAFSRLTDGVKNWASGIIQGFIDGIRAKIEAAKAVVREWWDGVKSFFGGGGSSAGEVSMPQPEFSVPGMASGGRTVRAGLAVVGEEGPELLRLPAGAEVVPLGDRLRSALSGLSGAFGGLSDLNALSGVAAGPSVVIHAPISGNTFRDRSDIDYLIDQAFRKLGSAVGRGVGNWRG